MEIKEAVDLDLTVASSWLIVTKTLKGYAVYQEHPTFTHTDRTPRPLAVFETKKALIEWMAGNWLPSLPEHELKCY